MNDSSDEADKRLQRQRRHREVMSGHPSSEGWTTLQTFRTPELTRCICARYFDCHIALSFWMYDTKKQAEGEPVGWEMTQEIILQHHAVVTLNSVYLDGMRDQLNALTTDLNKAAP